MRIWPERSPRNACESQAALGRIPTCKRQVKRTCLCLGFSKVIPSLGYERLLFGAFQYGVCIWIGQHSSFEQPNLCIFMHHAFRFFLKLKGDCAHFLMDHNCFACVAEFLVAVLSLKLLRRRKVIPLAQSTCYVGARSLVHYP